MASVTTVPAIINNEGELADETTPLLRRTHKGILSLTTRMLMLYLLFAILFGGIVVGIWLIIDTERLGFTIVSRLEWNARPPAQAMLLSVFPATYVIIIHTGTVHCDTFTTCKEAVRQEQNYFKDDKIYDDIGYNFLVGGDGRIYEGRGFETQGAVVPQYDNRSLEIAFIGNFEYEPPPKYQLDAVQSFLQYAVDNKKLAADYLLIGHSQVTGTDSPGQALYDIIRTWPNWVDCHFTC